ncbi:pyrroline-5-carboxylate reductase [Lecanosticta acicola]|uniref:Pyrroline-5-carboxylate reductase n=1 Tax=Lecanosticta acicola TaxID=111012 RepID=A0AAI8Z5S3_9PEZI|nr:pyrroline-5-carboxylate reductase [Lecanosticta acicola]
MSNDLTPDWILKQVLNVQDKAHGDWLKTSHPELRPRNAGLTLTLLGCGTMGLAILSGILESLQQELPAEKGASEAEPALMLDKVPSRFNACVRTQESAQKIKARLERYDANLTVYENDNLSAVKDSDVVLLCCQSQAAREILGAPGIKEALAGKLLISVCAGLKHSSISDFLCGDQHSPNDYTIVCAVPNAAAAIRQSMTIIATPDRPISDQNSALVDWIFTRIGRVMYLPSSAMDASMGLCGSGPAFMSLVIESLAAGGIAGGIPRDAAYTMAAQVMRGTSEMILQGEHPAVIRDRTNTPGGSSSAGLHVLEENAVRGAMARAVREATVAARDLEKAI